MGMRIQHISANEHIGKPISVDASTTKNIEKVNINSFSIFIVMYL